MGLLLVISSLALGLFFSRVMTLTTVDATTSVGGLFVYADSNYIVINIFFLYYAILGSRQGYESSIPERKNSLSK